MVPFECARAASPASPPAGLFGRGGGAAWLGIALGSLLLTGCEAIAESLADESDPRHVGARAPTLIHNDAYGNPILPPDR